MVKKSPNPVAVLFADSHLGIKRCEEDGYFSFRQIVDYVIAHGIRWAIAAGDLLDKKLNDSDPIVFLEQELGRLHQADCTVLYTQGQHEFASRPWFSIGESSKALHRQLVNVGPFQVYGLDFQPGDRFKAELADVPPETDILVTHQVYADFMGHTVTMPQGEFADIPGHVKLLVTGDFHECVHDAYRNAAGNYMDVFSPGCSHQSRISEPADCYFGVLNDDMSIDKIKLRTRMFSKFNLLNAGQLDEFLTRVPAELKLAEAYAESERLPEQLRAPYWHVRYGSALHDVEARIAKAVGDSVKLYFKENQEERMTAATAVAVAADDQNALTLQNCLGRSVDANEEPEVAALCVRLLDAQEPAIELAKWRQEILAAND